MEFCFKRFSCCAFLHPGLDGLLEIQRSEGVATEAIQRITLRLPASGYKVIDNNPLRSHCAQYVLALAAARGCVSFHDILNDQRDDPQIRSLSTRIEVIGDAEFDRTYPHLYRSVIEITTMQGVRYMRDVSHPAGCPEAPPTRDQLQHKFLTLTSQVLIPARAEAIRQILDRLEEVEDIRSLTELLAKEFHEGAGHEA